MLRKTFDKLSGTHITLMLMTAIVAPSALYASVTYQPVSIVDATYGNKAKVDGGNRLYVYDTAAGVSNNTLNYVQYENYCNASSNTFAYTPPTGKAFILKAVEMTIYDGTAGSDNYVYLYTPTYNVAYLETGDVAASKNSTMGTGYYLRNGQSLYLSCSAGSSTGDVTIMGYLVAAANVPPAAEEIPGARPALKHGKRF